MGARNAEVQVSADCWASHIHKQLMSGLEIPCIKHNVQSYNTLQDLQGNGQAVDQSQDWVTLG